MRCQCCCDRRRLVALAIADEGDNIGDLLIGELQPELRHAIGIRVPLTTSGVEPFSNRLMSDDGSQSSTMGLPASAGVYGPKPLASKPWQLAQEPV